VEPVEDEDSSAGVVPAVSGLASSGLAAVVPERDREGGLRVPLPRREAAVRPEDLSGVGVAAGRVSSLASSTGVGSGLGSSMRAPVEVTRRVPALRDSDGERVGAARSGASAISAGAGANEPPKRMV
jgi:hypothetical protein